MKREKKITIAGLTVIGATLVTLAAVCLPKFINVPNADGDPNQITFSSSANLPKFSSEVQTSDFTSDKYENGFSFEYQNFSALDEGWATLSAGSYLRNTTKPLNDLTSLTINADSSATVRMYFARNDTQYSDFYSRDFTITAGNNTLTFDGHPAYFKMVVKDGSGDLKIKSMNLNYNCDESTTKEWDKWLGATPYITTPESEQKIVSYGAYPDFYIDPYLDTFKELYDNLKAASKNYARDQYIYYPNDRTDLLGAQYFFYDSDVQSNPIFYSVSPIMWRYVTDSTKGMVLDSGRLLNYLSYDSNEEKKEGVTFNDSTLKRWLSPIKAEAGTGTFYNQAFALDKSFLVRISTADPSEITVKSGSYVYIPTKDELVTWYSVSPWSYEGIKKKAFTDFARGIAGEGTKAEYWTRTQYTEGSFDNYYCDENGNIDTTGSSTIKSQLNTLGIAPSITLSGLPK